MSGAEASRESVDSAAAALLQLNTISGSSQGDSKRSHQYIEGEGEGTSESSRPSKRQRREVAHTHDVDQSGDSYIQDALTGRRIYPCDAMAVVQRLQEHLPAGDPFIDVRWEITEKKGRYVGRLVAPDIIPLHSLKGGPAKTPSKAEELVCFHLCQELASLGLLDHIFFPKGEHDHTPKKGSSGTDAEDPESSKSSNSTRRYGRKRPQFFANTLSVTPTRLFPLIVRIGELGGQHYAPMLILARASFPRLSGFKIFSSGANADVSLKQGAPFDISEGRLCLLHRYSLRIFRTIMNKPMESPLESFPFLFAPLPKDWKDDGSEVRSRWQLPSVGELIPWQEVQIASEKWATNLIGDNKKIADQEVDDCIIQDRAVEFTNRHFLVQLRHDLTPLSKPEGGLREAEFASFLEYCKNRRKDFQGIKDPHQPMIEVIQVPNVANHLAPTLSSDTSASPKSTLKYLIPELCFRFTIPASTFRTALLLPSITHMLECMLLTKELNATHFDGTLSDDHLLRALTPPMTTVEYNYERLELLGDAYLKYLSSAYLYVTMPGQREGALNHARAQIVSNKVLRAGALKFGLPPYIQSKPLNTKVWQPCLQEPKADADEDASTTAATEERKEGKGKRKGKRKRQQDEQSIQWLGDKTVADVVEAIVGAALQSDGYDLAFRAAKLLQIDIPLVNAWTDLGALIPTTNAAKLPQNVVQSIKKITGYDFKDSPLLREALTHTTATLGSANYERLEFLGDAVLDMLTVSFIFKKYPLSSPGTLTFLKSAMVSNSALAALCVMTGLHELAQYGSDIGRAITGYAKRINGLQHEEYKRARAEGRLPVQFWLEAEPPKILSDIVEAVVGAIFVNEGCNIEVVQTVFDKVFKPFYIRHVRLQTLSPHPSSTLFQLLQAEHCHAHGIKKEVDGQNVRCNVVVHETVLASGTDRASNMATRKAASAALDALAADPGFMSRVCDCRANQAGKKAQNKTQLGYEDDADALAVERALTVGDADQASLT